MAPESSTNPFAKSAPNPFASKDSKVFTVPIEEDEEEGQGYDPLPWERKAAEIEARVMSPINDC